MSEYIPRNGSPQAVYYKTDDQSVLPLVPAPVLVPIHLPLTFSFASWGDHKEAYLVLGDSAMAMYGSDFFDLDSTFATFQTPFTKMFNEGANAQFVQRLVPEDAKVATLRFYAETVKQIVPIYQRSAGGELEIGDDGQYVKIGEREGIKLIWRKGKFPDDAGARRGKSYSGSLTNIDGTKSDVDPILDLPAACFGKRGSNIGAYISCPNTKSQIPVDPVVVEKLGARIYQLQYGQRASEDLSPSFIRTIGGGTSVQFSLKKGAYYRDMRQTFDYRQVVLKAFRNMNPSGGVVPTLGPVDDFYFYDAGVEKLQKLIAEASQNEELIANPWMVDIFTGLDIYGDPYDGLIVDNGLEGGEVLAEDHIHYLIDGADGTTDNATYDRMVREEMEVFGQGTVNYLNMQRYPFKFLWDSGFTTDTKKALCNFMGRRPDTLTVLSTHVAGRPANSEATESAMAVALAAFLRAHPESLRYGTAAMRGAVVGHSYLLNDPSWVERVPLTYSLAKFISRYAGSQEERFDATYRFDRGELAIIEDGHDINLTYKSPEAYANDWDYGLINVRSFDTWRFTFSAARTIHPNDRSVCAGLLTAIVIAHCEQMAGRIWIEMTGDQSMTEAQREKMMERKLLEKTTNKFDTVADVTGNAYHTEEDRSNGYSIHMDIVVAGNKVNTQHKYTIRAVNRTGGE